MYNRVAKINDMIESPKEVELIRGFAGENHFFYDYIYKWSRMIKICKELGLHESGKQIVELGGGLAPIQFILANQGCKIYNLDLFPDSAWFPTNGKFYVGASAEFIEESKKNIHNISFITGDILTTIKNIPANSIDAALDTCALHQFVSDELMHEIERVLKPGGYMISIGDVANPHLGGHDVEFYYPLDLMKMLTVNDNLKLIEPYDYETWESELINTDNIIPRKYIDYNNLSLMNMKNTPSSIQYGNIPRLNINLWTATYVLRKS